MPQSPGRLADAESLVVTRLKFDQHEFRAVPFQGTVRTWAAIASGVLPVGTSPFVFSFSLTSAAAIARFIAALSFATISAGVPAGDAKAK